MLFNVEYNSKGEVVIALDQEGLDILQQNLKQLSTEPNHVHLMTPSNSGWELTEEPTEKGNILIHQLTIFRR
ncbi:MAG TPA: Imm32 family immunity protein [Coleofasciculaceae cyanobacterium]|jgi:hypothetical protein